MTTDQQFLMNQAYAKQDAIASKPRSAAQLARSAALKAAKDAKRHAAYVSALVGPLKVGSKAFCGYWRTTYTVLSINTESPEFPSLTVRWDAQGNQPAHNTTHRTHWDARGGDRIISQPEAAQ